MLLSTIILIIILFTIIIIIFIIFHKKKKVTIINEDALFYVYREDEFPLNIYFYNETMNNPSFPRLYSALQMAVYKFNNTFNFGFFVINQNVNMFPNILMVQIACGIHLGCLSKFDDEGGILAHATYPPYRKICMDCKDINYNPLDIVIMHEMGHILGLTHSRNTKVPSVMNAYINANLTGFTEYDIRRIRNRFKFLK